ncbi:MAG: DNA (cytosine-5-)-methyltransferase [Alphaproteobacteria bacterium]|nr:DNA (cytosine-5-)-methyltransferase [Alphaproteobacteria bacterium]MBU1278045.1 DNA (cytosine-5-)-methyltransferase [Alphaproteobacteria bacterium]MBU1572032.1 DNA (cytosine-5-)-methyltransferase [Alphaproteobacteria bacterium]MBU1828354.1 DNA (cytosine-5-)-methyltransferase [Alphaproteobacteria bacterium]MBU2078153.1 DNA (cytosine-5-)-methyltransferase [Alphaproteobacteria bacterium]
MFNFAGWRCATSCDIVQLIQQDIAMDQTASPFKFIDLFAGIGGLRRGFDAIGGECVFTCEMNKFSQETYRANFGEEHEIAGDITLVDAADIPAHDLLLAGFPCQPFSLAGVSKKNSLGRAHGFADETQGTLFFDVVRILRHHKPRAFLLENVKNLLSHDKGNTMRVILHALDELGYEVDFRVIDARSWVPQHRERIFIAGFRRDHKTTFSFNDVIIPAGPNPTLASILHPENGSEAADERYTVGKKAEVHERYTLTDGLWSYLQRYAAKHKAAGNGFGFGLVTPDKVARTLSARYHKDGSEILVAQRGKNPRRLTPRECARLMGFDRPGTNDPWKIPVSDTQAYRQFGNAVAAPVSVAIAEAMSPWLTNMVALRSRRERIG